MSPVIKQSCILLISLLFSSTAFGSPINKAKARAIATKVFKQLKSIPTDAVEVETNLTKTRNATGSAPFHIFNSEDGEGFAVISGDDALPDVLAYSDCTAFPTQGEMPPALSLYLESLSAFVKDLQEGKVNAPQKSNGETTGTPVIGPLLTCQWGQGTPYNLLCPMDGGYNSAVGCIATAMAQIMYYHKWPERGMGDVSYSTDVAGVISVDFSQSTYNWSILKDRYAILDGKKPTGQMVAKLCYDCGVATRMKYSSSGSGTYDDYVMKALYTNFGYKASSIDIRRRNCFSNQEEWNNLIYSELNALRPFQFSAASSKGDDMDAAGHSFVIDGYDSNGLVHVNWGWNGSYDGYYAINIMDCYKYAFSEDQSIVIGIEPDRTGQDKTPHQYRMYVMDSPVASNSEVKTSSPFYIEISSFYNYCAYQHTFTLGIGLFSPDGKYLNDVTVPDPAHTILYKPWNGLKEYGEVKCKMPTGIPDGYYCLRLVFKEKGYDDWQLPDMVGGDYLNCIYIQIKNGTIYFNDAPTAIQSIEGAANEIIRTDYYDLSGRKLDPQSFPNGLVIKAQTLSNGQRIVRKEWVNKAK